MTTIYNFFCLISKNKIKYSCTNTCSISLSFVWSNLKNYLVDRYEVEMKFPSFSIGLDATMSDTFSQYFSFSYRHNTKEENLRFDHSSLFIFSVFLFAISFYLHHFALLFAILFILFFSTPSNITLPSLVPSNVYARDQISFLFRTFYYCYYSYLLPFESIHSSAMLPPAYSHHFVIYWCCHCCHCCLCHSSFSFLFLFNSLKSFFCFNIIFPLISFFSVFTIVFVAFLDLAP